MISVDEFRQRLGTLLEVEPDGAVVFDADGTLWSHDVGCMVFDWAVEHRLFRPEAAEALLEFAAQEGLTVEGRDVDSVVRQLQRAFYELRLGNHATAIMQVWAYVGTSEDEFRAMTREALEAGGHSRTLHEKVLGLARWVKECGARAFIVSASPQWVVEEATRELGFSVEEIAAGRPNVRQRVDGSLAIAAGLAEPLPYGPEKVVAGKRLLGDLPWLAALGDSSFDLEMFQAARLAGGLGSKDEMLQGLSKLPHGVRLSLL